MLLSQLAAVRTQSLRRSSAAAVGRLNYVALCGLARAAATYQSDAQRRRVTTQSRGARHGSYILSKCLTLGEERMSDQSVGRSSTRCLHRRRVEWAEAPPRRSQLGVQRESPRNFPPACCEGRLCLRTHRPPAAEQAEQRVLLPCAHMAWRGWRDVRGLRLPIRTHLGGL